MTQFGLSSTNSHWSYSSTGPYSPYLTSCTTPTASQFNNPSLGFTCSSGEQAGGQDFSASARDCVTSKYLILISVVCALLVFLLKYLSSSTAMFS